MDGTPEVETVEPRASRPSVIEGATRPSVIEGATRPSLIDALAGRVQAGAPRRSLAITGLFLLALGAVLYVGRAVFLPLTLALMMSFVFSPLVRGLNRLYVPKELASAVVVLGLVGGIGFAALQLSSPASEWATRLPRTL